MGHGYRPIISKIRVMNPNKKGTGKANYNSLHYIATREGVDLSNFRSADELLNVDLGEKEEEQFTDVSTDQEFLKYMANRPRSHGLFGNIETEKFGEVAQRLNKASSEKKPVYRGIISLSEKDGEILGYNNVEKWRLYLQSVIPDIAEKLGVSQNDMTWVAAFHAEQSHPHVHYMLWDNRNIVRSPYIHVSVQKEIRNICQEAMFTKENEAIIRDVMEAERKEIYEIQNLSRKEITEYFHKVFGSNSFVPGQINEKLPSRLSAEEHRRLDELYKDIISTMPGKGKIAYKFMPAECKAYIDQVSDVFLKHTDIRSEYNKYLKAVRDIHKCLGKTDKEIAAQERNSINNLYSRVGNIVLKGVYNMKRDILENFDENDKNTDSKHDEKIDSISFGNFSYVMLRQIFSDMSQARQKKVYQLNETEFKINSKQQKKEEKLHQ